MLRVKIEGIDHLFDVYNEREVAVTYSISDFRDLSKRQRTFSKTIKVVGDARANEIFANLFDIHYSSDSRISPASFAFSPRKKYKAHLLSDDIIVLSGAIKIIGIDIESVVSSGGQLQGPTIIYEFVIYSDVANIAEVLKSRSLKDLDFGEYEHVLNHANIRNSQTGTVIKNGASVANFAGGVPLGWGYFYAPFFLGTKQTIDETLIGVNMPMCYYVKEIFLKIFAGLGLQVTSTFINYSQIFRRLLITGELRYFNGTDLLLNPALASVTNTITEQQQAAVQPTNDAAGGGWRWLYDFQGVLDLLKNATIVSNPNSVFEINSYGGLFSPAQSGKYKFTFSMQINPQFPHSIDNTYLRQCNVLFRKNGTVIKNDIVNAPIGVTTNYNAVVEVAMTTTDTLTVEMQYTYLMDKNTTVPPFTLSNVTFTMNVNNLSLSVTRTDVIATFNQTINPTNYLPDISQYDFVNGVINLFNLQLGEIVDGVISIEPYPDFYLPFAGNDWTDKVDSSERARIVPLASEINVRDYVFEYRKGNDYLNSTYRSAFGVLYGNGKFATGIEFSTNDNKHAIKWDVVLPATLPPPSSPLVFPQYYDLSGGQIKPVNNPPVMFFYAGSKSGNWQIKDTDPVSGTVITDNYTNYPLCTHYDSDSNPSVDLCFQTPQTLFYTPTAINMNTLFWKYYQPMFQELIADDSKLVITNVHLTDRDIFALDLRRPVMIDGVLFRINKIIDYSPSKSSVKCELLRISDYKIVVKNTQISTYNPSSQGYKTGGIIVGDVDGSNIPAGIMYYNDITNVIGIGGVKSRTKLPIKELFVYVTETLGTITTTEYYNSLGTYTFTYMAVGVIRLTSTGAFNRPTTVVGENVLRYDIVSVDAVDIYYTELNNAIIVVKIYY